MTLPKVMSYSLSDGVHVYDAFEIQDGRIFVMAPGGNDFSKLTATFTHTGAKALIGKDEQVSGVTQVDFSSSSAPVIYTFVSESGMKNHYYVYLFDLPLVFIDSESQITSKKDWMENAHIRIIDTDGTVDLDATTSIKGRGNTTWEYPKKPYTIKLDAKSKVLGMPSDKRWNFLANWADRTLMRNAAAFAISGKTDDLEWTPRGKFVEVVMNGVHLGNYYLCEHIKIAKNRVNIREMDTSKDLSGDALTGGYLLEIDSHYDETYKFRSKYRNLPVLLKSPDENVNSVQLSYIRGYIDTLENMLADHTRLAAREYEDYLDIDSFIDYFLVHELAEYAGPADDAYSSHCYKDCLGKLKAGPVWDFDRTTFKPDVKKFLNRNKALWYGYLFDDPVFVSRLKEKWSISKADFEAVIPEIDAMTAQIRRSAQYTLLMWPTTSRDNGDETMTFQEAAARLKKAYSDRITVLDQLISSL